MKAIDLHIHTIKTIFDADFSFDIKKLEEYVNSEKISCIAITNHNLFDKSNYELISNTIDISVLPGIEVSLEKGHMLVIGNINDTDILVEQSNKMRQFILDEQSYLTYEQFLSIFDNYKDYLLIPHYIKDPPLPIDVINKFGNDIIIGEVSSAKKWFSLMKQRDKLIPVLFSDLRIKSELKNFPGTHLYIDCDDFTIGGLKNSFKDKTKLSLSNNSNNEEFQITSDGTTASLGLNVLIGKRSTGKTYLLDKLNKSFGIDSVKYIEQFSIIKDAEEGAFKKKLELDNSEYSENYLKELKDIVDLAFKVDFKNQNMLLESYLESLLDFASKQDKMDIFSKCTLFNATYFEISEDEELQNNIKAIDTLLSSSNYEEIIFKYLDRNNLKELLKELIIIAKKKALNNSNYKYVNDILKIIKTE
ncbi:phosphotransferase domain-containing protein, partial [human gut metagenome]